ncbi:hypothetical protein BD324DRAFT_619272 [Kockovaella imperatae]|uniref:Sds3-like-domain-containing protein n=1 Tax=Kockovaella imperatae TaxID=4999 RepID=A0A1Y1UMP4_9TREE|nr:hypothetical protein BD324DRAFT_619272 [Kockovaella imperatae]ORX39331.1 hypothetical protein BD324DRAFT_619272 [Kockovaella imperatae]
MAKYLPPGTGPGPTIIPPQYAESKRDRKRRETINKIEMLHDESWRNRDEKFATLYKDYHNENRAVNSQPPTSSQYYLRLYPRTVERDALLESAEVDYQYKAGQAKRMYESERETIERQYWDARDQVRQRLLQAIEERRRKLREEKEGGDVVSETLLEAQIRPRPSRRMPFRNRLLSPYSRASTPALGGTSAPTNLINLNGSSSAPTPNGIQRDDLLLHTLLAPALAQISVDDIISSNASSLAVNPPPSGPMAFTNAGKRGPRGKMPDAANGDSKETPAAPGTLTALAIASGQQAPAPARGSRGAGAAATGQWVLGKSLAELKRMESASQLEIDSDWARIQGSTGRGRRNRGDGAAAGA